MIQNYSPGKMTTVGPDRIVMKCSKGHEWEMDSEIAEGLITFPGFDQRWCGHCLMEFLAEHIGIVSEAGRRSLAENSPRI